MTPYEKDYYSLLNQIVYMADMPYKNNRTKSRSIMSFGKSLTVNLQEGFPILSCRKMFPKTFFTELKWFIEGETNIKRFKDAGIKIWDKWADKNGELGPVYGFQLRNWGGMRHKHTFDQLNNVLCNLKYNPESRRHVVTLWDPDDIDDMELPPCYHSFTFCVTEDKLNIDISMRSSDVFVGLPYDVALFATMCHLICKTVGNLKPGKLKFNLTDAHVYWDNVNEVSEYMQRVEYEIDKKVNTYLKSKLYIPDDQDIYTFQSNKLKIQNYNPKSHIKVDVVE